MPHLTNAMSNIQPEDHPIKSGFALSVKERILRGRKCGKYDFDRFKRLVGSAYHVGEGNIGDVEVSCKFLFRESRWGVLKPEKNPGGIVYLDLTFAEPPGCHLKGATVSLTLDEADEELQHYINNTGRLEKPEVPVQIVEYGPKNLKGRPDRFPKSERRYFAPSVDVNGMFTIGGVGKDSELQYMEINQWRLSSHSTAGRSGRPETLRWYLDENKFDSELKHDNTFHTALAFEHDGQPFFMRVEVSGYLRGAASRLRHKATSILKEFKFPTQPQYATTLVDFGGRKNPYQDPLDKLVETIPSDMLKRNISVITEVPEETHLSTGPTNELPNEGQISDPLSQLTVSNSVDELEGLSNEELLGTAGDLLSQEERSMGQIEISRTIETRAPINIQRPEIIKQPPATSNTLLHRQQIEVPPTESHTNQEEVQKMLKNAGLPTIFQMLILWILAVGLKISSTSKKNIHTRRVNS